MRPRDGATLVGEKWTSERHTTINSHDLLKSTRVGRVDCGTYIYYEYYYRAIIALEPIGITCCKIYQVYIQAVVRLR